MAGSITLEGIEIDVVRKKGRRSMTLSINAKTGRPTLSIPYLCPLLIAKAFAAKHLVWLKANIKVHPAKQTFVPDMQISLLGQPLCLKQTTLKQGAFIQNGTLYISGHIEHFHRRTKDFIKVELLKYITHQAQIYAEHTGQTIKHITVRDTFSRWGSCSGTGHLSFSWRLALAPKDVLDYVIAHEVAHLTQMNHSPQFWQVVRKLYPEAAKAKNWLKQNGGKLHSFL